MHKLLGVAINTKQGTGMRYSTQETRNSTATTRQQENILTKAVLRASVKLGITDFQLAQILGIEADLIFKFKNLEKTLGFDSEPFHNAALLVRVFRSLSFATGGEQEVGRSWMNSHNTELKDSPIEFLTKRSGLEDVVKYLDSRRAPV